MRSPRDWTARRPLRLLKLSLPLLFGNEICHFWDEPSVSSITRPWSSARLKLSSDLTWEKAASEPFSSMTDVRASRVKEAALLLAANQSFQAAFTIVPALASDSSRLSQRSPAGSRTNTGTSVLTSAGGVSRGFSFATSAGATVGVGAGVGSTTVGLGVFLNDSSE